MIRLLVSTTIILFVAVSFAVAILRPIPYWVMAGRVAGSA